MRKWVSAILCITLIGSMLTGCGQKKEDGKETVSKTETETVKTQDSQEASGGPITIQFWNGWTGSDGQVLIELVDEFNKNNPWDITVEMDISSDFGNKFVTSMAAGAGPDLILSSAAGKYSYEGQLADVSDIWDNTTLNKEDFVPTYLDACATDDGLYGIPFQISSYYVYWNKDLFQEAGLDPEMPPKSYEEWTEIAGKITNQERHVYGSGLTYGNVGANACLMQMFGGRRVEQNDSGIWEAHVSRNTGYERFVEWFKGQFESGNNPVEGDMDTMFIANQLGLYVTGAWLTADLDSNGINYGITPLPYDEGGKHVPSNTQCFSITNQADNAEKLACERFIQWWHTGNEGTDLTATAVYRWSDEIGYPAYYIPVMNSAEYMENPKLKAITVTDTDICADSVAPGNFSGWMSMLNDVMVPFFEQVVYEDNTEGLLEEAQKNADKIVTDINAQEGN